MKTSSTNIRKVRYSECDMYGIMHNIEYLRWLEDEIADSCGEEVAPDLLSLDFKSRFLHALRWGDLVEIKLEIEIKDDTVFYRGHFRKIDAKKNAFLFSGKKGISACEF